MTAQSVFVTGASGFIGTHLVRALAARGWRVTCFVRGTSRVDELRAAGALLLTGELDDRASIARGLASSNARVVFHLAGLLRSLRADSFMRVNAGGVDAVAAACVAQLPRPVLVVASSLAAAGPSVGGPKIESDPPLPVSDYGRSKLAGEEAAAKYAGELEITVVRPGIVFGGGDRAVCELFKPIARSGIHVVCGSGDARVSLVAAGDLVECMMLAGEKGERIVRSAPGSGVYFAAAEDLSHADLGRAIARALGRDDVRIVRIPRWAMRVTGQLGDLGARIRRRPGWISGDKIDELLAGSWTCSSEKARRQLGWSPSAPLGVRLREAADWYRDARWL